MSQHPVPGGGLAGVLDVAGRRVSVRRVVGSSDGRPVFADVVGVLEEVSAESVVVRRRDGTVATVERASVVGARLVPAHPRQPASASYALSVPPDELERVAARGWPGTEQGRVGEWLLRAGHGFTGRANAALPIGDPGVPLTTAVSTVEQWYSERGLPARFQVPLVGSPPVDDLLAGLGYEPVDGAFVLVADLLPLLGGPPGERTDPGGSVPEQLELRLDERPDDGWLAQYHYRGGALPADARAVIEAGGPLAFASVRTRPGSGAGAGEVLAIARGAVSERWLGVTAVEVVTAARRRGLATAMLLALSGWAEGLGALAAYLQVAAENEAAYQLYARAGFVEHHRYHYRRLTV